MTLDCIVCGKRLPPAITLDQEGDRELDPPYGGTKFTSNGNYGSVFDPSISSDEFMELNVCDHCLLEAAVHGRVAHGRARTSVHVEYEAWDPARFSS